MRLTHPGFLKRYKYILKQDAPIHLKTDSQFLHGFTLGVITGKGHNSAEKGPVLKREVKLWLERNGDTYIASFQEAPPRLGGSGAILLNFK